ncbi:hypothetical protein B0H13DRAFT_1854803 [Mycena leptocephala]|nr:hypothetical protein B0H13DRAFT_1854803 [Mycena leptocephala]
MVGLTDLQLDCPNWDHDPMSRMIQTMFPGIQIIVTEMVSARSLWPVVANRHTSGAEEQDLLPRVLKLPGAESHATDPAWEHLNEGTKVPVSLPLVKSGGNNSEDSDERNADGISQANNYQRFELLILVAATISHHSQSSHRDPVAVEFSGETTPQQIANLRGEISQLRGQLESLQVTVETLSKNMQQTTLSSDDASEARKIVRKIMTPPEPSERKRVLIKETKPPKIDSDSEDDALQQPEPVVKKGKQPHRGVAKPIPIKGTEVPKEVLTKTDSDSDDDVVSPPEPVVKVPPFILDSDLLLTGAAKSVFQQRRNVVKELPKTDSDSDEEVVSPPEPVVKVPPFILDSDLLLTGAAKGVPPKRRNIMKEAPSLRATTHSDSEPPGPTVKVPTFILDSDLFLTGHRKQSLAELSPRPSKKLAVAPRRSARSVFVAGAKKSANMDGALAEYQLNGTRQSIKFSESAYEEIYRYHCKPLAGNCATAPKTTAKILHAIYWMSHASLVFLSFRPN